MRRLFYILFFIILSTSLTNAQQVPLWEGIQKTPAQKLADKKFVASVMKTTNGNLTRAGKSIAGAGWKALSSGNVETAIKRFNQLYLVNPKDGQAYWGLAVAAGVRGDPINKVKKLFNKAKRIIGPHWRLTADYGRTLEQRGYPKEAIKQFKISIKSNPKNREPHIGMIRAATKLGNRKLADKHRAILSKLKADTK